MIKEGQILLVWECDTGLGNLGGVVQAARDFEAKDVEKAYFEAHPGHKGNSWRFCTTEFMEWFLKAGFVTEVASLVELDIITIGKDIEFELLE